MGAIMNKEEILQLEQELTNAELDYRLGLNTNLSDEEFDKKSKQLKELYNGHIPENSVLNQIVSDKTEDFKKVQHSTKMLSLDNTYNLDELHSWITNIHRSKPYTLLVQEKIDGCSLSCVYENHKLIRIVTRGDGIEGEDITSNIGCINGIPLNIPENYPEFLDVRGEVYMEYDEFNRINNELEKRGEKLYANPRNLTAGTIKLLDVNEAKKRKLNFIVHSLGKYTSSNNQISFISLDDFYAKMHQCGFNIVLTHVHHYNNDSIKTYLDDIDNTINNIDHNRNNNNYPTDGAVLKINNLDFQKELGETSKVPRWGIAYKFEAEKVKTKVKSITLQVGRTGAITPVAELEPVLLSGSTVKRATCHNIEEMIIRDIRVGDNVMIEKSGEIIPYIIESVKEDRTEDVVPYVFDGRCPVCGSKAEKIGDLKHWFCTNPQCLAILKAKMEHFVSRDCMDIENVSGAWVEAFVNAGLIHTFADFYNIQKSDLMKLDRMGSKLSEKILNNISASTYIEAWRVLNAIGIPGVGKNMAKIIMEYFNDDTFIFFNNLQNTKKILSTIPNIAEKTLNDILTFITNNINDINKLLNVLTIKTIDKQIISDKLKNKTICITGSFNISREEIIEIIKSHGGKFVNSVSKKLDYLLVGENPGSKLAKAEKLGIPVKYKLDDIL